MTLAITNGFGNVDVRQKLPGRYAHVPGERLQPLCRKLGIKFAPALVGWQDRGQYPAKPLFDGVVVAASVAAKLRAAIAERVSRSRVTTPEERERARQRRQDRDIEKFSAEILRQYPGCPVDEAAVIARHACQIGSGRVGHSRVAEDPVRFAVVAHIRHQHTEYDELLDASRYRCLDYFERGDAREEARYAVSAKIDEVLARWEKPQ